MQTRKLSVKTFYDLTLADCLRVCFVVHTPPHADESQISNLQSLFLFRAPIRFFQNSAVVSAAKIETVIDVTLGPHACAT